MISDITLGQYYRTNSLLHRLDARTKTVLTFTSIIATFFCHSFASLGLTAAFSVLLVMLSGVPIRMVWRSVRPLLWVLLFTAAMNLFYQRGGNVLVEWKFITITTQGVYIAIFMAVRIVCLVIIGSLLTYTTTPTQLTDALERLLSPLRFFKIPVHTFAMMMTLALRFIPVLLEEIERIMNAQKARGADWETGGLFKRAKALIPIFVPLLVSAFRRAYDLALAMECRCYTGGKGRTRMQRSRFALRDGTALLGFAAFMTGVLLLNYLGGRVV
ncbi:MAG: energy-coupling factor transporter transmembrane protein EcfT [Oscillospiraceae bacterium]|jgi:energy-coupling factor transport system permease protein|nr:energy-coupling factor transporter transmembrane protein EcfT [Oscillospiraceae bacterium]